MSLVVKTSLPQTNSFETQFPKITIPVNKFFSQKKCVIKTLSRRRCELFGGNFVEVLGSVRKTSLDSTLILV